MDLSPKNRFKACTRPRRRRAPKNNPSHKDNPKEDKNIARMRSIANQHRTQFLPSNHRNQFPGGLFLNGRVCEPVHKNGKAGEAKSGFNFDKRVNEQSARLKGDLQGLLKINSKRSSIGSCDNKKDERNLDKEKAESKKEKDGILEDKCKNLGKVKDKPVPENDDIRRLLDEKTKEIKNTLRKNEELVKTVKNRRITNLENIKKIIKEHHGDRSVWDAIKDVENEESEKTEKAEEPSAKKCSTSEARQSKRKMNETEDMIKSLEIDGIQSTPYVTGWIKSQKFENTIMPTKKRSNKHQNKDKKHTKKYYHKETFLSKSCLQNFNVDRIVKSERDGGLSNEHFFTGFDFSSNNIPSLWEDTTNIMVEDQLIKHESELSVRNEDEDIYHLYKSDPNVFRASVNDPSLTRNDFNFPTNTMESYSGLESPCGINLGTSEEPFADRYQPGWESAEATGGQYWSGFKDTSRDKYYTENYVNPHGMNNQVMECANSNQFLNQEIGFQSSSQFCNQESGYINPSQLFNIETEFKSLNQFRNQETGYINQSQFCDQETGIVNSNPFFDRETVTEKASRSPREFSEIQDEFDIFPNGNAHAVNEDAYSIPKYMF